VHSATPLTTTRKEVPFDRERSEHVVKYITYKVTFLHGVAVRNIPSYDAPELVAGVKANQLVETCSDMRIQEVIATTGQKIVWMQLISHFDGWVPMCTPAGEPMFELVNDQSPERLTVSSATPASPTKGVTSKMLSEGDLEIGAVESPNRSSKRSIMRYDGTDANVLRIQSQTMKTNPCFRVVSCGENSNLGMQCGLYFALPGYSNKVWSSFNDLHVAENAFHLCVIDRVSGEVDFAYAYDVIGDGQTTEGRRLRHLVHDLNQTHDGKIVVVFTTGTPGTSHRKFGGLGQALDRCGCTGDFYKTTVEEDSAFILIGIAGNGQGTGYEVIQGGGKAANIDLNFEIISGGFNVCDIEKGVFDSYCCCSNKSFIFAVFQKRTAEENDKWRAVQMKSMPSYYTLCRLEHEELCAWFTGIPGCGKLMSPLTISMSICGLGHFFTKVGTKAWYYVIWKIGRFFLLCLGYWTDDLVETYEIHKNVREMSVIWEKPFQRKSKDAYNAYRLQLRGNHRKNNEDTSIIASKPKKRFADYFISLPAFMAPEGGWIEDSSTHEETEEMVAAQQEDLKRKLRAHYAAAIHAMVATRAVLLHAIPALSFLSIYATTMSATPIMVHSKRLANNLPELIISEPFVEARAQEQESIDEQEWIRRVNFVENQNRLPNPKYEKVQGKFVKVGTVEHALRAEINNHNRERVKEIMQSPSRVVDEWIVAINGITLYMTESRGINFLINLYKFILTVGMIWTSQDKMKYWMASSVLILFPHCLFVALGAVTVMGKALYITDKDLEDAGLYRDGLLQPAEMEFTIRGN